MEENKKIINPVISNPGATYCSEKEREHCFTLLDHFAGLAMQSLIVNGVLDAKKVSVSSYAIAEQMLKNR